MLLRLCVTYLRTDTENKTTFYMVFAVHVFDDCNAKIISF